MRDGINVALTGTPAVALITEPFWQQGVFVSQAAGMPDIPRLMLPHPVAGSGTDAMVSVARSIARPIITLLTQSPAVASASPAPPASATT